MPLLHMSINVFRLLFFHIQVAELLYVNTESLFKLSFGFSNIFLIAAAADNCIYKVGSFSIEIRFQNKWLVPVLKFKEFNLNNIITGKTTFSAFVVLKVDLFVEKFEEHKNLFKLDDRLLQSINLWLVNILPKVFEVWRFPYIFLVFNYHADAPFLTKRYLLKTGFWVIKKVRNIAFWIGWFWKKSSSKFFYLILLWKCQETRTCCHLVPFRIECHCLCN